MIGNVVSYPIRSWTFSNHFDVVIPEDDEQVLTTEMYMIRLLMVAILVLTGGFFAGTEQIDGLYLTFVFFLMLLTCICLNKLERFDFGSYGTGRN